jgi:hypothetical protein
MNLSDRRVIADKVLVYLKKEHIGSCLDSSKMLDQISDAINEPKYNIWKAYELLRMMARIELNSPNGRKGFKVLDYTPLTLGIPDRPPKEQFQCPLITKAVRDERKKILGMMNARDVGGQNPEWALSDRDYKLLKGEAV